MGTSMNSLQNAASTRVDANCMMLIDLERRIDRLKSSMHLAVIFGGHKATPESVVYQSHNSRSWKSYEAVANDIAAALRRLGFRYVDVMPEDMRLGDRLRRHGTHMAWLNTGGVQGRNAVTHAPSMLEMMGVPYVGHDPLAATLLDNKHAFKRAALSIGLPTPQFVVSQQPRGLTPDFDRKFERAFGGYIGPFVVKPVSGRASLHVHVVPDIASLRDAVDEVHEITQNAVLIEQFLSGREVCIAVSGPVIARNGHLMRGAEPTVFSAIERVLLPSEQIFTSMDERPITQDRTKLLDRRRDAKLLDDMSRLAQQTYHEFDLGSVIRLDLRADEKGELYILEANPKPDLKAPTDGVTSLICAGLGETGMDYDNLILSLLADRLDFLFTRRPDMVRHLTELIQTRTLFDLMRPPAACAKTTLAMTELVADINVMALKATRKAIEDRSDTSDHGPARSLGVDAA
jgi:D-alanine-D-alanine ligase